MQVNVGKRKEVMIAIVCILIRSNIPLLLHKLMWMSECWWDMLGRGLTHWSVDARHLSRAQRTLSKSLNEFNFECIGSTQTDDEQVIADSLKQFSKLISAIEEERDNMLDRAHDQIVGPLEEFRKCHIGGVKENKKKYDKKTAKFCQAQERFLNMSSKKPGTAVVEIDCLKKFQKENLKKHL
ncbi:hypothetical protein RP20_CCG005365 [Aedes albopictus]|nr:hypothetical protein RP20_CCG005365 [Aedes albopictus]